MDIGADVHEDVVHVSGDAFHPMSCPPVLFRVVCVLRLCQRLGELARNRHRHLHAVTRVPHLRKNPGVIQ